MSLFERNRQQKRRDKTRFCEKCGTDIKINGWTQHEESCRKQEEMVALSSKLSRIDRMQKRQREEEFLLSSRAGPSKVPRSSDASRSRQATPPPAEDNELEYLTGASTLHNNNQPSESAYASASPSVTLAPVALASEPLASEPLASEPPISTTPAAEPFAPGILASGLLAPNAIAPAPLAPPSITLESFPYEPLAPDNLAPGLVTVIPEAELYASDSEALAPALSATELLPPEPFPPESLASDLFSPGSIPLQAPESASSPAEVVHSMSVATQPLLPLPFPDGVRLPAEGDYRVEHHPRSKRAAEYFAPNSFQRHPPPDPDHAPLPNPWSPYFESRLEFEIAELALETGMTVEQTNRFLDLIHRARRRQEDVSIKKYSEVKLRWEAASQRTAKFHKEEVHATYGVVDGKFDVYYRDVWEWTTELLRNPRIFPQFIFDAQKFFRFDGGRFSHVIDEPFTADLFWNCQSRCPDERGKPICFILYADKTKLSSFGTAKAYPVVARIANLPVQIRNGTGVGGGHLVGWLPIVKEDNKYRKAKLGLWANFKNVVWHESFKRILRIIATSKTTGLWLQCADGIIRLFFLFLQIISADYEEQCTMASTRGNWGLCPCPICLVPKANLFPDLTTVHPLRTTKDAKSTLKNAREAIRKKDKEKILKDKGQRDVESCFWDVEADVHSAFTYDRLHVHLIGLWADHLGAQLQVHIGILKKAHLIDDYYKDFPRWRGLKHPTTEYVVQSRSSDDADISGKNWGFPKLHAGDHVLLCIMLNGVLRNYDTKPNEQTHGPLKDWYLFRTNFREFAAQILRIDHWMVASDMIRTELNDADAWAQQQEAEILGIALNTDESPELSLSESEAMELEKQGRVRLGSKCSKATPSQVEKQHELDDAFSDFPQRLDRFIRSIVTISTPLTQLCISEIVECRLLVVCYQSKVDWQQAIDLLRVSPMFYRIPHYDCVIIRLDDSSYMFGRLLFMFKCQVGRSSLSIGMILPFTVAQNTSDENKELDRDLNFFRLKASPHADAAFISLHDVERGALLAPDPDKPDEFLVVDTVDRDMFLRVQQIRSKAM
ncbi:hypothetical protein CONPUDRAFT_156628 [Coniophora puteana RWD-64-598 SS2]|uniref:Uncharacterized protein n=1 Tax=Coniophora puteana (strain RWD-64-598) TaxID=741705 RepID=A0A5M3MHI1_CONPW|nr:uncharacterized protein CONPUDRAFT_156628 [Coniophora puteana RWD-64-598 SS2]EIW78662.1 hypothetical protein CONPUDRAFT_156628 [Coniophora puteana RWD-64-598 SS2]